MHLQCVIAQKKREPKLDNLAMAMHFKYFPQAWNIPEPKFSLVDCAYVSFACPSSWQALLLELASCICMHCGDCNDVSMYSFFAGTADSWNAV
jgi:hypothetical protein